MEYKQAQLLTENVMLKNVMTQYQTKQEFMCQKMQKILYVMCGLPKKELYGSRAYLQSFRYDVFMNTMASRGHDGQRRLDGARYAGLLDKPINSLSCFWLTA
jgi:hypothetical protein